MLKEYLDYLKDNPNKYWFKRKIYGWGWTPATWQGWLTLLLFLGAIIINTLGIDKTTPEGLKTFIVETIALILILLFICYRTGEKPKWQWGLPKK